MRTLPTTMVSIASRRWRVWSTSLSGIAMMVVVPAKSAVGTESTRNCTPESPREPTVIGWASGMWAGNFGAGNRLPN
jgi:hypothetical protein